MGKFNEIIKNVKQSFDGNDIQVNILPDKVIIDSEKKVIEVNNTLRATNIEINGVPSECFTSAEKEKLNKITTPMQVVGRVDSVELLPTDGVIGSVYLVGMEGSTDFTEYIVISLEPTTYESIGKIQTPQVQSDWNQIDSESSDFVKNKPFYEDIVDELALSNPPVNGTMYFDWGEMIPILGKKYFIEYDLNNNHNKEIGIGEANTDYPEGVLIGCSQGAIFYNPDSFSSEGHNVTGKFSGNPSVRNVRIVDTVLQKLDAKFIDGYIVSGTGNFANKFNALDINVASGNYSHAEGYHTTATKTGSHAEGIGTTASGNDSHAEGGGTTASGNDSHAEGYDTEATGAQSHSEGYRTTASGSDSHAEGMYTVATHRSQHVFGEYNIAEQSTVPDARGNYIEIVGNGAPGAPRSNARTLDWQGNEVLAGGLTCGGNIIASGTNINEALGRTQGFSGVRFRVTGGNLQVCIDGTGAMWKTITLV